MQCGLGGEGAVQSLGLGLAGDIDDAAPVAPEKMLEEEMGELAMAAEVEGQRLLPLLVAGFEREAAAAAGVVDEDICAPQSLERRLGDALRRPFGEEVLLDDDQLPGFLLQVFEEVAPPGGDRELDALLCQRDGDRAADAHARARDERALAGNTEIHL